MKHPQLWREWLAGARPEAETRSRSTGNPSRLTPFESVPGFDLRYGPGFSEVRENPPAGLHRSDYHLVHGDSVVVSFTDHLLTERGFGHTEQEDCLSVLEQQLNDLARETGVEAYSR